MKAVVVTAPKKVNIMEVPDPVIGDYSVICRTLAAAVCGGTDNHIVDNHPYFKTKYPTILGHEGIGRVVKLGQKVKNYHEGDMITRVLNRLPDGCGMNLQFGAFAELTVAYDWEAMRDDGLPEGEWKKYKINRVLPADFDPVASTMIITWRETYSFLKRMDPKPGEVIIIIGSGANALSFANHAINLGLEPSVIGNPNRQDDFKGIGVGGYISYKISDYIKTLNTIGIKQADIIIDCIGQSDGLNKIISLLRNEGKIGLYGLDAFLDYSFESTKTQGDYIFYNGKTYNESSAHDDIINYIQKGKLNPWNYLSREHIYSPDKINEALAATRDRKTLKSVVKF